jgi:hypothetical protein
LVELVADVSFLSIDHLNIELQTHHLSLPSLSTFDLAFFFLSSASFTAADISGPALRLPAA